jgi:hypothetical protein
MTLLGVLLALAPRLLYTHSAPSAENLEVADAHLVPGRVDPVATDHTARGLTALYDQQLGGILMLVVGGASYLLGGLWLTAELLRDRRRADRGPGGPGVLGAAPVWRASSGARAGAARAGGGAGGKAS